ncbi:hypothetical protein PWP93_26955 [Paraburkholderia sp. A1RI-2L]|uniref:hypothetical protein n=1 Tax=Paraburkholderia sp. A1RI-2L TaxID=3028367 RepID=UPI003B807E1E
MSADVLLDKLEGARVCGPGRWRARCPVCDSRRDVLAVAETADGVVLLHCFHSGCGAGDIAAALGLDLADLFPPRVEGVHIACPVKKGRRFHPAQALAAVNLELLEVLIVLGAVVRRGSITPTEFERVRLAVSRVSVAEGATHD